MTSPRGWSWAFATGSSTWRGCSSTPSRSLPARAMSCWPTFYNVVLKRRWAVPESRRAMMQMRDALGALMRRENLNFAETHEVMRQIMTGEASDAQVAAFLMGMAVKGETAEEISARSEEHTSELQSRP